MPYEAFVEKTFRGGSMAIIDKADQIIGEYQQQGFTLTLRQLYYQFVARGLIANKQTEYKRLGSIINDARLAGLLDWSAIEDRTRNVRSVSTWDDPSDILQAVANQYRSKRWDTQPCHVEVWIEKDALVGVIEPVCEELLIPYFACRGYTSQSEQWRAGKRFRRALDEGKSVVVLHLGDHDPSGIDMTRDNLERLAMFAESADVEVRRLALNFDQVKRHKPPPNPAKESDSRIGGYSAVYGGKCWELDALDPPVIDKIIRDAVDEVLDQDAWAEAVDRENRQRNILTKLSTRWEDVADWLRE